jgi:hypothetical protein
MLQIYNVWVISFLSIDYRAVDNQVYVATASPARDDKASYVAWGHSTIVNPWWVWLNEDELSGTLKDDTWSGRLSGSSPTTSTSHCHFTTHPDRHEKTVWEITPLAWLNA